MKVVVPISVGELLDKISILEIKSTFTDDEYVNKELDYLNEVCSKITYYTIEYIDRLREVNRKLWTIEDMLRKLEKEKRFDQQFIDLARSVYIINDERARIKKEINEITNSEIKEIKLYE
jgi:hypothetical protein